MPQVDPDDDAIERFVVWHYAYDPVRRERRNQTVATYDNVAEFEETLDRLRRELVARKQAGLADPEEGVGGVHHPPGHRREMQLRRQAWRRIRR